MDLVLVFAGLLVSAFALKCAVWMKCPYCRLRIRRRFRRCPYCTYTLD
jgi:hypothetical protein